MLEDPTLKENSKMRGLICPNCKHTLEVAQIPYFCPGCNENYPLIDGIPLLFNRAQMVRYRMSKGTVQEYYRHAARNYGETHHVAFPGAQRFLVDFEQRIKKYLYSDARLLEIGAGTGFATHVIARYVKTPVITDASLEMLLINKTNRAGLMAFCCTTENLPFSDEMFDAIIGNNTFYLVPNKREGMRSIARVLRKGGRLVLSEMNPYMPLWPILFVLKGRFFESSVYQIFPFQMKALSAPFGMEIEKVDYYSSTPYFAGKKLLWAGEKIQNLVKYNKIARYFSTIRIFYVLKKV